VTKHFEAWYIAGVLKDSIFAVDISVWFRARIWRDLNQMIWRMRMQRRWMGEFWMENLISGHTPGVTPDLRSRNWFNVGKCLYVWLYTHHTMLELQPKTPFWGTLFTFLNTLTNSHGKPTFGRNHQSENFQLQIDENELGASTTTPSNISS
jgi:hypothetical protein